MTTAKKDGKSNGSAAREQNNAAVGVSAENGFDAWAVVELMGHRKLAGRVSEQVIAGGALLRIDVPEVEGQKGFTTFYGVGSLYSLTPTTEKIARLFAARMRVRPIESYELKALPQPEFTDEND